MVLFFGWTRELPSEFAKEKMGRIANLLGFFLKSFPRLIILLHYIVLILLLVMIGQVGNGSCARSVRAIDSSITINMSNTSTYSETKM
jgi:hypothetical protein